MRKPNEADTRAVVRLSDPLDEFTGQEPLAGRRDFLKGLGLTLIALPWLGCGGGGGGALSGRVVVVGAGLSGLLTAMLLEERGVAVTVVEARDRLGGRVLTADGVAGNPESGGPVIGESYRRVRRIAEHVGVGLGPGPAFERDWWLYVNETGIPLREWTTSPANRLSDSERQMLPFLLMGYYMGQDLPLEGFEDWINPRHAALDIPITDYLRSKGASDEAMRLINVSPNTNDIATTSTLWALRDAQRRRDTAGGGILGAEGGNSRLIERMAASIRGSVLTGKPVSAIRSAAEGVEVSCNDGSSIEADYAVVTVPFSVLRGIEVDPPFEGAQKEAVEQLPYTPITKYFLVPKRPFWDEDGLAVSMWTDTGLERFFPVKDAQGQVQNITCWVDGPSAARLDAMTESEQIDHVLGELARIRPATRGAVDVAHIVSWGNDPFARGAYAHYAPGQVTRLKPVMARPWKRIHFAGEHTAVVSPGMEGAMESAERASNEVLERLV